MRERPILFNGPMVRAILAGHKTQTRRVVKPQPAGAWAAPGKTSCPYGQPGDRLWVRETWAQNWDQLSDTRMDRSYVYRADGEARALDNGVELPWRPSIHMPRSACRLMLEVTGVRVERLNDISDSDCWAEGIEECDGALDEVEICHLAKAMGRTFEDPQPSYAALWEQINGPGSWHANPWVWVVEFRRIEDGGAHG
ncbi:hypothetical protein ACOTEY_00450 [Achromobacter xylosoxidans]